MAEGEEPLGALPAGYLLRSYEVISVLGEGAFGITYLARDTTLGREVAIKEYLPSAMAVRRSNATVAARSAALREDFIWGRERFLDEARTLAKLEDAPAVVRVIDFLEANGTAYMVMALVRGQTLRQRIRESGPVPADVIDRLLWPLLDGLEQVHAAGFLHRDIKPSNILLDARGRPTLIDFGAARMAAANRGTAEMTAIYTPGYAAPEQFGSAAQGPWTDIYGMSATLYHAIAGKRSPGALERVQEDKYRPLAEFAPSGFAPGLLAAIDAGMAVRAAERPQSIAAWRELLRGTGIARGGRPAVPQASTAGRAPAAAMPKPGPSTPRAETPAMPAAAPPPGGRDWRRRPSTWMGIAAAVIVLAGAGVFIGVAPGAESRRQAALDAKQKAEKALKTAELERRKAEEELARLRAEEQAAAEQKAREEAALKEKAEAEAAAKRLAEEEEARRRQAAAAQKAREEAAAAAKRQAEEEARRVQAAAAQKAQEEAALKEKADAEAAAKRRAEEEEQRRQQAAAAQKAQEEAALKEKADAEAAAKRQAEEAARRKQATAAEAATAMENIDKAMRDWIRQYGAKKASLALSRDDRLVLARGYDGRKVDDRINVWQQSTAITAVCAAALISEGKLKLDDKLGQIMQPVFARVRKPADPRVNDISIADLLTQRSGWHRSGWVKQFPDDGLAPGGLALLKRTPVTSATSDMLLPQILAQPLAWTPGEQFGLSSVNYLVLGETIEAIAGEPYDLACASRTLTPAGINRPQLDATWGRLLQADGGWWLSGPEYLAFLRLLRPRQPDPLTATLRRWMWDGERKWIDASKQTAYSLGVMVRPSEHALWAYGLWNWQPTGPKDGTTAVNQATYAALDRDGTAVFASFEAVAPEKNSQAMQALEKALWGAIADVKSWPETDGFQERGIRPVSVR
jgi:CubicO group peptidase (beta-lactamase class C family)/tRNA A-37 threonylcarbamoyl transferase component Bud32